MILLLDYSFEDSAPTTSVQIEDCADQTPLFAFAESDNEAQLFARSCGGRWALGSVQCLLRCHHSSATWIRYPEGAECCYRQDRFPVRDRSQPASSERSAPSAFDVDGGKAVATGGRYVSSSRIRRICSGFLFGRALVPFQQRGVATTSPLVATTQLRSGDGNTRTVLCVCNMSYRIVFAQHNPVPLTRRIERT